MRNHDKTLKIVLTALFIALAYVLPFFTGQIEYIGNMLAPMHLPIILCGFVCGWKWGIGAGIVAPLLRSLTMGMPPIATAICMSFELATYGGVAGIVYDKLPKKTVNIYLSLIAAMIAGRISWGIAHFALAGFDINEFGVSAFWAGAVTTALPGIIVQLVLIPLIVIVINKRKKAVI